MGILKGRIAILPLSRKHEFISRAAKTIKEALPRFSAGAAAIAYIVLRSLAHHKQLVL